MSSSPTPPSTPQKPEWLIPKYPKLKDDLVGQAAVEGQIVSYPQVVRTNNDPPISGQRIGALSFMVLEKPLLNAKTGKYVFGFVKARGNWADADLAIAESSKIVKKTDSKFKIFHCPVGAWVPFSEDPIFVEKEIDVKMEGQQIALRDQAMREKEEEQKRIMRELRENEDLAKSGDIYDDPTSLKYYSMKRVTLLRLMEERDKYIKHIESVKASLDRVMEEMRPLEKSHPEYQSEWIGCYNAELRKAGIPDHVHNQEYMDEYLRRLGEDGSESSSSSSQS